MAQEQATNGDAAQLSSAEVGDFCVARGAAQGLHGFVQLVIDGPRVTGVDLPLELPG